MELKFAYLYLFIFLGGTFNGAQDIYGIKVEDCLEVEFFWKTSEVCWEGLGFLSIRAVYLCYLFICLFMVGRVTSGGKLSGYFWLYT